MRYAFFNKFLHSPLCADLIQYFYGCIGIQLVPLSLSRLIDMDHLGSVSGIQGVSLYMFIGCNR